MPNFQALPRIFRLFWNCCIARDITAAMLVVKNKSISLLSGNLHCDWENREHLKHLRNVIVLQEKSQSGARKLNPRRCTSSDKRPMGMCRWMGSHFHDWIDNNGVVFLSYVSGVSVCIFVALYLRMFVARANKVECTMSWCVGTNEILASIKNGIA